jgi:hypothetical protein
MYHLKKTSMKKILNLSLMLAGIMIGTVAFGQKPAVVADSKPGWHRLGALQASFKKQNESIHIMGNDEFTALKFKIVDAPIHIERMQVFYESGDMEDIDVKKAMSAGESSGALQLKHAGRDISKIAFTYHSVANNKSDKAEVEIYGLKTGTDSYNQSKNEAERDLKEAKDEAKEEANEAGDKIDAKSDKAESDVERAAEKTGDQVSETAAKTAAEIDDKRLGGKVGPGGQVVYISDDGKYYYISEEGKRVFVTETELRDK